jgi:diacylglycerol kinase family enzyme
MSKRIVVIANPAAGQDEPVLGTMNKVFGASEYKWDLWLTKQGGDGKRLALQAIEEAADIVAVYGGDGSVREVASALAGSDVPMAILPGGTANVMSVELGIPGTFEHSSRRRRWRSALSTISVSWIWAWWRARALSSSASGLGWKRRW